MNLNTISRLASAVALMFIASVVLGQVAEGPKVDLRWHRTYPAGPYSEVATAYGHLETEIPLFDVRCIGGMKLSFSLRHRSNIVASSQLYLHDGTPARGWFFNMDSSVVNTNGVVNQYIAANGVATWGITTPFGASDYVRYDGTRSYLTRFGTQSNPTGFEVRHPDRSVWTYTRAIIPGAHFKLTSIEDGHGNTITLTYDGQNRVTRVTDPSGLRYYDIAYGYGSFNQTT